jgi:hypothetical protein
MFGLTQAFLETALASNGESVLAAGDEAAGMPGGGGGLEQQLCRLEDAALVLLQVNVNGFVQLAVHAYMHACMHAAM